MNDEKWRMNNEGAKPSALSNLLNDWNPKGFYRNYSLFTIHYSLFIKKFVPDSFYCRGRIFTKIRGTTHDWGILPLGCFPPLCKITVCGRQRLPRTHGSARSALGSPFAVSLSRVSSIGGSLWQRRTGTILRHRFMMLYHSTFFVICQGVWQNLNK